MFPNLQYTDRACDLKCKPTFLILLLQGKLVLAAIATWLDTDPGALLASCCCVFFSLAYLTHKIKPCLVAIGDDIRFLTYILAFWVALLSLVQHWADSKLAVGSFMIAGSIAIILSGIWWLKNDKHPSSVIVSLLWCMPCRDSSQITDSDSEQSLSKDEIDGVIAQLRQSLISNKSPQATGARWFTRQHLPDANESNATAPHASLSVM